MVLFWRMKENAFVANEWRRRRRGAGDVSEAGRDQVQARHYD